MIFRLREYKVVPEKIGVFNAFFREHLLPVQQKYGAKLIGRWQTEDYKAIYVLWAYAGHEEHRRIQHLVSTDAQLQESLQYRRAKLDPLYLEKDDHFLVANVPLGLTELAHLEDWPPHSHS